MKTTNHWAHFMLPFFFIIFIAPSSLYAQVKVDSTGALSVGRNPIKNTYLSIGDNNYVPSVAEAGIGIYLHGNKALLNNTKRYYGVYSCIAMGKEKTSIGLYGRVLNSADGSSYGVIGVANNQNGVGVYGTVSGYGNVYGEPVNCLMMLMVV